MKKTMVLVLGLVIISITGCSATGESAKMGIEYNPHIINPDYDTITAERQRELDKEKRQESSELEVITENIIDDIGVLDDNHDGVIDTGEVVVKGTPDTSKWAVDGDDIIYNEKRFEGLVTASKKVSTIATPDQIIAMIVKSAGSEKTYYIDCVLDSEIVYDEKSEIIEYNAETFIVGDKNYENITEKYGAPVNWRIDILGEFSSSTLYGCESYMIVTGISDTLVVDVGDL